MKNVWTKYFQLLCLSLFTLTGFNNATADVTLPVVLSDHMVLQRDMDVRIWGWADKNEAITVEFNNQSKNTKAGPNGTWQIMLDPMPAGGPYNLLVKGKNAITINDILLGDVWICSGQSNMRFMVKQGNNAEEEIVTADYPMIRLFNVKTIMSGEPENNLTDEKWEICSPKTVGDFSAVGYYFGRDLQKKLNIPIGLIESSWGGTLVESWTSAETIDKIPDFDKKMKAFRSYDIDELIANKEKFRREWDDNADKNDIGLSEKWYNLKKFDATWNEMELPQRWEDGGLEGFDGIVWFQTEFELTREETEDTLLLSFDRIDDTDYAYVNGKLVGTIKSDRRTARLYKVSPEILKQGKNILIVRILDHSWSGGFVGEEKEFYYKAALEKHSLVGKWKYKIGNEMPTEKNIGPNSYPTLLYNSMINPLINFGIKGVIWYQGESNTRRAYQYQRIFPAMITDWRNKWNQGDFPFVFVQLANYMEPENEPGESQWAELREAQNMALELPNTGIAVIIDIGEADDIHPKNKQDVGYRLSLAAQKIAYDQDIVYSGPIYKSIQVDKDKVRIKFDHIGSGLCIKDKYGYLKGFAVAGKDRKFVWAKAYIDGSDVIVFNETVKNPVAVRYGWADNPDDVNLYNKEGLPASPFRTDDWPGITE